MNSAKTFESLTLIFNFRSYLLQLDVYFVNHGPIFGKIDINARNAFGNALRLVSRYWMAVQCLCFLKTKLVMLKMFDLKLQDKDPQLLHLWFICSLCCRHSTPQICHTYHVRHEEQKKESKRLGMFQKHLLSPFLTTCPWPRWHFYCGQWQLVGRRIRKDVGHEKSSLLSIQTTLVSSNDVRSLCWIDSVQNMNYRTHVLLHRNLFLAWSFKMRMTWKLTLHQKGRNFKERTYGARFTKNIWQRKAFSHNKLLDLVTVLWTSWIFVFFVVFYWVFFSSTHPTGQPFHTDFSFIQRNSL